MLLSTYKALQLRSGKPSQTDVSPEYTAVQTHPFFCVWVRIKMRQERGRQVLLPVLFAFVYGHARLHALY